MPGGLRTWRCDVLANSKDDSGHSCKADSAWDAALCDVGGARAVGSAIVASGFFKIAVGLGKKAGQMSTKATRVGVIGYDNSGLVETATWTFAAPFDTDSKMSGALRTSRSGVLVNCKNAPRPYVGHSCREDSTWDAALCDVGVRLSPMRCTAMLRDDAMAAAKTRAVGSAVFASGFFEFTVKLDTKAGKMVTSATRVGVIGHDKRGLAEADTWTYASFGEGVASNGREEAQPMAAFGAGDSITVRYRDGRLNFALNGVVQGSAFELDVALPLRIYAECTCPHASWTITSARNLSTPV